MIIMQIIEKNVKIKRNFKKCVDKLKVRGIIKS